MPDKNPWFVLAGPTGVGKTELSIVIAKVLNAEILSADSMQIYRGMDIGTSKPGYDILREVPHHLIDCVDPSEIFSVGRFVEMANESICRIRASEKNVLVVGGTGMYLRSLLEGLFEGPPRNSELRERIEQEVESRGISWLRDELKKVDPVSEAKIGANDLKRLIRALEVFRLTGKPLSSMQSQWDNSENRNYNMVVLCRDREDLYKRIEKRVDQMMAEGLVNEVKGLIEEGISKDNTALQAIGYKEIVGYLQDEYPLEEAVRLLKRNTRRLAKRQMTWFRGMKHVNWFNLTGKTDLHKTAQEIVAEFRT